MAMLTLTLITRPYPDQENERRKVSKYLGLLSLYIRDVAK